MPRTPLAPPTVDQATIDYYVAKGRRERSRAVAEMVRAIFSAPRASDDRAIGNATCT